MDPLCHTLTGAVLAQAGLKQRTALATATLLLGANAPDIDVFPHGISSLSALEARRGWTHGAIAIVVLPVVLAAGMTLAWDAVVRRWRRPAEPPAVPGQLLLLAAIGVVSHYLLDFLNTYGVRFLMPFSDRWFYGDAVFIVDPWMWLVLAAGLILTRRWSRHGAADPARPARVALGLVVLYVGVMLVASAAARHVVSRQLSAAGLPRDAPLMVAPQPVNPFRRLVLVDAGDRYMVGRFAWLPGPALTFAGPGVLKGERDPAAAAAAASLDGRAFLRWARFPFYLVERTDEATIVHIGDARYTLMPRGAWAAITVRLPAGS